MKALVDNKPYLQTVTSDSWKLSKLHFWWMWPSSPRGCVYVQTRDLATCNSRPGYRNQNQYPEPHRQKLTTRAAFLSLWLTTLWGSNDLFTGVTYQITCITDIYITAHDSSKVTVMKQQWNYFMVGAHLTMANCIKGLQHIKYGGGPLAIQLRKCLLMPSKQIQQVTGVPSFREETPYYLSFQETIN